MLRACIYPVTVCVTDKALLHSFPLRMLNLQYVLYFSSLCLTPTASEHISRVLAKYSREQDVKTNPQGLKACIKYLCLIILSRIFEGSRMFSFWKYVVKFPKLCIIQPCSPGLSDGGS